MEEQKNTIRMLQAMLYAGIGGAVLMFAGDMLLYGDIAHKEMTQEGIIATMRSLNKDRIMAGGALGPLATLLYCFGFYAVCSLVQPAHPRLRLVLFLLFCLGSVYGGTYHSQYPHLAFTLPGYEQEAPMLTVSYIHMLGMGTFIPWAIASLIFQYAVLRNMTLCRKHLVLLAPLPLSLLNMLVIHLPPPLLIIVAGGWNSILFAIFFSLCLIELNHCVKKGTYAPEKQYPLSRPSF